MANYLSPKIIITSFIICLNFLLAQKDTEYNRISVGLNSVLASNDVGIVVKYLKEMGDSSKTNFMGFRLKSEDQTILKREYVLLFARLDNIQNNSESNLRVELARLVQVSATFKISVSGKEAYMAFTNFKKNYNSDKIFDAVQFYYIARFLRKRHVIHSQAKIRRMIKEVNKLIDKETLQNMLDLKNKIDSLYLHLPYHDEELQNEYIKLESRVNKVKKRVNKNYKLEEFQNTYLSSDFLKKRYKFYYGFGIRMLPWRTLKFEHKDLFLDDLTLQNKLKQPLAIGLNLSLGFDYKMRDKFSLGFDIQPFFFLSPKAKAHVREIYTDDPSGIFENEIRFRKLKILGYSYHFLVNYNIRNQTGLHPLLSFGIGQVYAHKNDQFNIDTPGYDMFYTGLHERLKEYSIRRTEILLGSDLLIFNSLENHLSLGILLSSRMYIGDAKILGPVNFAIEFKLNYFFIK